MFVVFLRGVSNDPGTLDPVPGTIVATLRTIDLAAGAEARYADQLPRLLDALREQARIESITASSAIEGVIVAEFAGYTAAQDYLQHDDPGSLSVGLILHLHRLLFSFVDGGGGRFKLDDDLVVGRNTDGTKTVRFEPVPASQTDNYISELVDRTNTALDEGRIHPLLVVAAFGLDVLCIHPFADGNGRVTRLLTAHLMQRVGHGVGRYVAVEQLIFDTKDDYYVTLAASTAERTASVPDRGPGLEAPPSVLSFGDDSDLRASRWRMAIIGSAAAAMIVGLVLVAGFRSGDDEPAPAASGPTDADPGALAPVVTLTDNGDLTDVPVTVLTAAPAEWYRLAPDLDVAWYQDQMNGADAMVCWRTPAGSDCQVDNTRPDESVFVVPTGGGQTLVVMIAGDTRREVLDVLLDDGVVLVSPIEWDDTINWGVARYAIPEGAVIGRVGEPASIPSDTIAAAAPADVESSTSLLGPIRACATTNGCEYVVSAGDYPLLIAERFCVTITELTEANGWGDISEFPFPDVPISIPSSDGRTTCPDPTG